ncbi:MAG: hypothetical protein QF552_14055 [Litorilituus sp.]|jgi:hypothetical protein|nr:hypothetical protein [Litorilituus sp.]
MNNDDDFLDNINAIDDDIDDDIEPLKDIEAHELAEKKAQAQAQKNLLARKRIDELMEQKKLKELLDDEDDW